MKRLTMKVTTKSYTQVEYSFGLLFDGPEAGPGVPMKFMMDPLMDLLNGGRIHSLAAFFIDEFEIEKIPTQYRPEAPFICNKANLDGMTPYEIVWISVNAREFYEQGNSFHAVYKARKMEDKTFYETLMFLKDAR